MASMKSWRLLSALTLLPILTPHAAMAASCARLSYERNAIFKDAGYCFKTQEQIRNFGNAGCQFDRQADVPLSARDRDAIAEIVREERAMGCR